MVYIGDGNCQGPSARADHAKGVTAGTCQRFVFGYRSRSAIGQMSIGTVVCSIASRKLEAGS